MIFILFIILKLNGLDLICNYMYLNNELFYI